MYFGDHFLCNCFLPNFTASSTGVHCFPNKSYDTDRKPDDQCIKGALKEIRKPTLTTNQIDNWKILSQREKLVVTGYEKSTRNFRIRRLTL